MLFNSHVFIAIFLPLALVVYRLLGHRHCNFLALVWLIAVSTFYYTWWNVAYLPILVSSILINYFGALALEGARVGGRRRRQRAWFWALLSFNLGLLGYYKYLYFVVEVINQTGVLGWRAEKLVLPLAISFYTFEQLGYLFDVNKGYPAERRFLNYALFALFFPRLIAGPIVQGRWIFPLFDRFKTYEFCSHALASGIVLFAIGLFKKLAIADLVAPYADEVFNAYAVGQALPLFATWLGALAYTFQLYFDFSGYSDMAIGVALMFGIPLPVNFNSPYRATNIRAFWQRWHITLGEFLTNYVYTPLVSWLLARGGDEAAGRFRPLAISAGASLLTMLLSGVWHGAGWNFLVFGLLHGVYFVILHIWEGVKPEPVQAGRLAPIKRTGALGLTFLAVVGGWVLFRAKDLTTALGVLAGLVGAQPAVVAVKMDERLVLLTLLGLGAAVWSLPNSQAIVARFGEWATAMTRPSAGASPGGRIGLQKALWGGSAVLTGTLLGVLFLSLGKAAVFLYYNF